MKNTVIIYASTHHGNTKKLVEAVAGKYPVALIDTEHTTKADLSDFDLIGFASGIDFGRFYPSVEAFIRENLPEKKDVFFLYTCARTSNWFTRTIREEAARKSATVLGEYGCRGFNTYGPWKLIGGMNKGHPNAAEIAQAIAFVASLMQ